MVLSARPFPFVALIAVSVLACTLVACQPRRPAAKDPAAADAAALEANGYTHAPVISGVTMGEAGFVVISGTAPADSRMRFAFNDPLKGGPQAVGVTTDGQGQFRAEVPITTNGGLYDVTADDGGRLRQMEGRLFVPPGRPDKATFLRPGSASRLLRSQALGVMLADYDSAGAFAVSGRVTPDSDVIVIVNNEVRAEVHSDSQGAFDAETQVPPPGAAPEAINVIVQTTKASFKRDLQIAALPTPFVERMTAAPDSWWVDWQLPGGGGQSTVVFK